MYKLLGNSGWSWYIALSTINVCRFGILRNKCNVLQCNDLLFTLLCINVICKRKLRLRKALKGKYFCRENSRKMWDRPTPIYPYLWHKKKAERGASLGAINEGVIKPCSNNYTTVKVGLLVLVLSNHTKRRESSRRKFGSTSTSS